MNRTISAFTIAKNIEKYDYPLVESINSYLPYVDELVINMGISEDKTEDIIRKEFGGNHKVFILRTKWEDFSQGTKFFSNQTNAALEVCVSEWCLYVQADEVLHERDAIKLHDWIDRAEKETLQGITFKYNHFIKDPNHVRNTYKDGGDCYDLELRLFKNNGKLWSYGDAQSFGYIKDLHDPRGPQPALHHPGDFLDSSLEIYHYGYLRTPENLLKKKKYLSRFYDVSEPGRKENIPEKDGGYVIDESQIKKWNGTHPKTMLKRLERFK